MKRALYRSGRSRASHRAPHVRARSNPQSGFALIVVLLVLLALLVLCTPFLFTARNADRASAQLADRTQARIALDGAARHARAVLADSHPALDPTPYFDSLEEIGVDNHFDPAFTDANDPKGLMWDLELEDVAGKIDLNSAPPQMIANLTGTATRFVKVIGEGEKKELPLSSTTGLQAPGFVWAGAELIHFTLIEENALKNFGRGVLGPSSEKDWKGGPRPPSVHAAGEPVLDQRAFAPALWRMQDANGRLRPFAAMEELRQAGGFALAAALVPDAGSKSAQAAAQSSDSSAPSRAAGPQTAASALTDEFLRPLFAHGSVHGGVRGGSRWQHAVRLASPIKGGEDGKLTVDYPRWFNAGSTIEISDGVSTELALVMEVVRGGDIILDRVLVNDYHAYETIVRVLARRPVNINTAAPEVLKALFTNLQISGKNSRITRDEAQQIAELVVQSRPFEGFEDFMRRVVLPAAGLEALPADAEVHPDMLASGTGFIDQVDAVALYQNGLNANDGGLAYSTMPYCFTTRDVYAFELRSTVNAQSGVARVALVRDEVDMVTPQRELLALWARQEDFDEAFRLDCEAPWWTSGPNATARWDGSTPPSPLLANFGTQGHDQYLPGMIDAPSTTDRESMPRTEHVFASREDTGWVQLWPSRTYETGQRKERVLHFDHETRDPEGRYLPDQTVTRPTDDKLVRWTDKSALLMRPMSLSLWVKPRSISDSTLFDVVGNDPMRDRISLLIEGQDLVLRVLDGVGDDLGTPFKEAGELRYAIAAGPDPGLPTDRWSHVAIDVHGNRPNQMNMLVNGLAHGVRTPGMTRLTGAAPMGGGTLQVESTEGFPAACALRIGNEVIEATVTGKTTFTAAYQTTGEYAGFGGRLAREPYANLATPQLANSELPAQLDAIQTDHVSGTAVELYGYSLPLASDLARGHAALPADIGPFRVAMLRSVIGGQLPTGDPISPANAAVQYGVGLEKDTPSGTGTLDLVLASADLVTRPPADFMPAFNPQGGYAALIQVNWTLDNVSTTVNNTPLGGIEVFRYSGWTGDRLRVAQRGLTSAELPNLPTDMTLIGGRRAFIALWESWVRPGSDTSGTGPVLLDMLPAQTFVIPISMPVPGATGLNGYLTAAAGNSRFAQLTHLADGENTEWLRYDYFDANNGQLVRDDPTALQEAFDVLIGGGAGGGVNQPPPGTGGGGGGNGGGGASAVDALLLTSEPEPVAAIEPSTSSASSANAAAQSYSSQWDPRLGANENADYPLSAAICARFQFRGVFGTYTHTHTAGTVILPVFTAEAHGLYGGRPGHMDAVVFVSDDPTDAGLPAQVQRAHIPGVNIGYTEWQQTSGTTSQDLAATTGANVTVQQNAALGYVYIALRDTAPNVFSPTPNSSATTPQLDTRLLTRIVCFPSGERPRLASQLTLGGGANGKSGAVPPALVDEVVFFDAQFTRKTVKSDPETYTGASIVLLDPVDDGVLELNVAPHGVRIAIGNTTGPYDPTAPAPNAQTTTGGSKNAGTQNLAGINPFLAELPTDAGLLRLGDEIVCYSSVDAGSGKLKLTTAGRGLLGTRAQPHDPTEPVLYMEDFPVSTLTANVGATDPLLPIADQAEFPFEGTVLIGEELIHYTRLRAGALEMPRASSVAGKMDEKGEGLFRGRFGTTAATHSTGEAVILFPFRYWDRWAPRADAPEMTYFTLALDQPDAFWTSCFFVKEDGDASQIGVLQRNDPTAFWDGDPDNDPHLALHWEGLVKNAPIPIGKQSDRIDWRVFVKYTPGAFDVKTGLPHGWKQTPRLKQFGAFYFGPGAVLRSVER